MEYGLSKSRPLAQKFLDGRMANDFTSFFVYHDFANWPAFSTGVNQVNGNVPAS